jgi:hypothetical protein
MPSDREPDNANEHLLCAKDGCIICEFGGITGHVTVGSCDIEQMNFVRMLFARGVGLHACATSKSDLLDANAMIIMRVC